MVWADAEQLLMPFLLAAEVAVLLLAVMQQVEAAMANL
jgi:hypothetical protein